jgi:hypothetical protein
MVGALLLRSNVRAVRRERPGKRPHNEVSQIGLC